MDYKAFTTHFTDTCKRRLKTLSQPESRRIGIYHLLIKYLVEIASAHDFETSKIEIIERDEMDYIIHINEQLSIHCPVYEWQQE
jgi:REP element-mobilizing transposase RayT